MVGAKCLSAVFASLVATFDLCHAVSQLVVCGRSALAFGASATNATFRYDHCCLAASPQKDKFQKLKTREVVKFFSGFARSEGLEPPTF